MIGAILLWLGETVIGSAIKSVCGGFFSPKTATDQKLADAQVQLKDTENAKEISDKIDGENRDSVNADLNKWVR